ncbi:hypothetical protein D0T12_14860 [Actinomadura spongiicola]|uniref:Uncharacterized protein n=1 Tax=Actinomadura spongiicola TaxID=2303421 RepID=A0A372GI57_9ACTN|nr:hypothetical protein [Actinomadura spongiicola]RFS84799.1 hypothetical protein D0T12_14860 [Actinomadura spongiicola]
MTPHRHRLPGFTPARAKPGTEVRLVERFRARTPAGVYHPPGGGRRCLGEQGDPAKTNEYKWAIDHDLLPPGKYLVTPRVPMKITTASREGTPIPPESAGAAIDEILPVIEVLDG